MKKKLPKKKAKPANIPRPHGRVYSVRRKFPDVLTVSDALGILADPRLREQLAMPFADSPEVKRVEAQPFLKWAGGKASLLPQLDSHFPSRIERYFEPFLGGRAVFFHLKHRFPSMRAYLRDSNRELINSYRIVRDRPHDLMRALDQHAKNFRSEGETYFYAIRKQHDLSDDLARASRTIFLNKTCYNGLWRVNARGEFTAPSPM